MQYVVLLPAAQEQPCKQLDLWRRSLHAHACNCPRKGSAQRFSTRVVLHAAHRLCTRQDALLEDLCPGAPSCLFVCLPAYTAAAVSPRARSCPREPRTLCRSSLTTSTSSYYVLGHTVASPQHCLRAQRNDRRQLRKAACWMDDIYISIHQHRRRSPCRRSRFHPYTLSTSGASVWMRQGC